MTIDVSKYYNFRAFNMDTKQAIGDNKPVSWHAATPALELKLASPTLNVQMQERVSSVWQFDASGQKSFDKRYKDAVAARENGEVPAKRARKEKGAVIELAELCKMSSGGVTDDYRRDFLVAVNAALRELSINAKLAPVTQTEARPVAQPEVRK